MDTDKIVQVLLDGFAKIERKTQYVDVIVMHPSLEPIVDALCATQTWAEDLREFEPDGVRARMFTASVRLEKGATGCYLYGNEGATAHVDMTEFLKG